MDRLTDHLVVVLHDIGLDRNTVHRRFLENAHVTDPDKAHMQSPRDRRRCQGQNIHVLLHLLDLLFVGHTEPLLLIDDQKSKVLKLYVLRQDSVCADNNIHIPLFQSFYRLLHLSRCPEARHHVHPHRKILHSLDKGIVNLLCEDRCRDQIDHLLFFLHGFKSCPERDLRLSVAHIPADQAVHDLLALHVPLRIVDGGELVVRLIVGEHLLKFLLPHRIRSILEALRVLTRRVELHKLLRDLPDRRADLCLRLCPLGPAKLI